MASPNNKAFRNTLETSKSFKVANQVEIDEKGSRCPFAIIEKWARHPTLRKYHLQEVPYLLFGNQILLLEYSLKPKKGSSKSRAWFRIWEPFYSTSKHHLTSFRCEGNGGMSSYGNEQSFLKDLIVEYLQKQSANIYPKDHQVSINNTRFFSGGDKYYTFKVDEELKKRSQIAKELFEITALSPKKEMPSVRKTGKGILQDMIDPNIKDRWE